MAMRRSGPLRRVSAKKRAADAELAEARAYVELHSGGWCEARIEGVCTGRGEVVHHIKPRSKGVDHSPTNLLHCCNACHTIGIHAHPAEARARGLLA